MKGAILMDKAVLCAGCLVIIVGMVSNILVQVVNGGKMPYVQAGDETRLLALGDRFDVGFSLASIGDILMVAGFILGVVSLIGLAGLLKLRAQ